MGGIVLRGIINHNNIDGHSRLLQATQAFLHPTLEVVGDDNYQYICRFRHIPALLMNEQ
jgi:hypothetical protein